MKNPELKTIAVFKCFRGALAFGIGVGLLLLWQGSNSSIANYLHETLQLKAQDPFIQWVFKSFETLSKEEIRLISLLAFSIAIVRWFEGFGVWLNRTWAELLAIVTGCLYIPLEAYGLLKSFSFFLLVILMLNMLVVVYLLWFLVQKRQASKL